MAPHLPARCRQAYPILSPEWLQALLTPGLDRSSSRTVRSTSKPARWLRIRRFGICPSCWKAWKARASNKFIAFGLVGLGESDFLIALSFTTIQGARYRGSITP